MEKKIKAIQKKIENKRMRFEKRCMGWLLRYMNKVRDIVDGLSMSEYTTEQGQTLEEIAYKLENAEAYATDMIACMFQAETAKAFKTKTDGNEL